MFQLQAKLREAASHGAMSFLFALGMALTLLGVTGMSQYGALAGGTLAAMTLFLALISLDRRAALLGGGLALTGTALWLLIGGAGEMIEVLRALTLHLSGIGAALPLVGGSFTAILSILCALAAWFVTQRSAGAYPALMLLVLSAVLLWLGGRTDVLLCLLPAVLACVTLLLRSGSEQTGTLRVFPLALVVTAAAFCGLGGATFDPLKELADDIRQRIYDTFFYTQPRDVFTLATEGYYPQGVSQLGGPAKPREEPVMAVITPKKTYLRGVVKNVYTGRTWLDDVGGRRYLWSASRFDGERTAAFDLDLPRLTGQTDATLLTPTLLQVRMLGQSASTMFVPQRLRTLTPEGELIPYFNRSSEVFATANLDLGDVWTMEAALFTSQDSGLSALVNAAEGDDPNWASVCETYLQLPGHLEQEVYRLTEQAVQGASTPFDQALAIQHFLAANYAYNLDVPEQSPEQDFVSTFLLIGKEGYCTYFASAMTVMCRMAGLPARYVEGYVAYPDETGLALVTGKEGHAWTEVYFAGFGWVTFDATPISADYTGLPPENPDSGDESSEPSPEPTQEPTPTPTPEPSPQPEESPAPDPQDEPSPEPEESPAPGEAPSVSGEEHEGGGFTFPWWLLLILLAAGRFAMVQPDLQVRWQDSEFRKWLVYAQAAHDALRRHGFIRARSETPAAFFGRVKAETTLPVQELAAMENLMFYGHADPFAEETAQAKAVYQAVYRALPPRKKALFHLQRMVLPKSKLDITKS